MSFAEQVAAQIPSSTRMISGCHDTQTSADANITAFELPNPAGRRGGACTAALLQVLYNKNGDESWVSVLRKMRENLAEGGYSQVPQLSSSRIIDVNEPMTIVDNPSGTKRAVLIGINYVGQQGELSGCHNDAENIKKYLTAELGFDEGNMKILMDDGRHETPTYANIMAAFDWIVSVSQPGDTVWIHYSGHGGRLRDEGGDEDDGYDETLIPVDFQSAGQIRDDDLLKHLVKPMSAGVTMTCLMDCCHSGTVLDLPYRFVADGDHVAMEENGDFDIGSWMNVATGAMAAAAAVGVAGEAADIMSECCVIL